ncbi:MAG: hypothetical protein KTR31_14410 [Myxococcales bacterium]|nr:hypothetical protein [Myxococcales bacterium]
MASDPDKTKQRDRLRYRCPVCEAQVGSSDDSCAACGSSRPGHGWVRVTELVVHGGLPDGSEDGDVERAAPPILATPNAPRPPVHRTVYLEAPGAPTAPADPDGRHTLGLAATFLTAFALTTVAVLVAWTALSQRPTQAQAAPATQAVESTAAVEGIAKSQPEGEPHRDPLVPIPHEFIDSMESQPTPLEAAALDGAYSGTMDDAPVTFDFAFGPNGEVTARIAAGGLPPVDAVGSYRMNGRVAHVVLHENGGTESLVYAGDVGPTGVSGRVTTADGRDVRYFSAKP